MERINRVRMRIRIGIRGRGRWFPLWAIPTAGIAEIVQACIHDRHLLHLLIRLFFLSVLLPPINAMSVLLVGLQADVVSEGSTAEVTAEWLVTGMLPHMSFHVGLLPKPPFAHLAGVWLCVDKFMLLKILRGLECFPANLADARPF